MTAATLGAVAIFDGLDGPELEVVAESMKSVEYAAGEQIYREGEQGATLGVIASGLARVRVDGVQVATVRRGDVIGELSLLTGEPRAATVECVVPTTVHELTRQQFGALVARRSEVLGNLARVVGGRLARGQRKSARSSHRGEAVALLVTRARMGILAEVVEAAAAATPRSVTSLSSDLTPEEALARLDDLLEEHAFVLIESMVGAPMSDVLIEYADRAVALVSDIEEARGLPEAVEAVVIDERPARHVVARVGRLLSRTRLGLALGAGGAKGYAHVGVIQVLEEAGYTVDAVGGCSIGALIGAWHALGLTAADVDRAMRDAFSPETVEELFRISLAGPSIKRLARICEMAAGDTQFDDLQTPLVILCCNLDDREAVAVRDGPVADALVAAMALPGVFPPVVRDGNRLVDGLVLAPVPTQWVAEAGADIVVAVNLIARDVLEAWPGEHAETEARRPSGSRILDTLLEVMDLAQLDASIRHAAAADVVVTPRFGPASWRDFHLADRFIVAGREAAYEALPQLRALTNPAT